MYALVLAGGRGERLRPLTDTVPKPMVPVLDRPILWWHLKWLKYYGVTHVVMLVRYQWEAIRDYFGEGKELGLKITYSVESEPLGRGGAIRKGMSTVPASEKYVLATNGDVLSSEDLGRFMAHGKKLSCPVTIMLAPLISPYGIVEFNEGFRVTSFREKPRLPHWINAGTYFIQRSMEERFPLKGDHEDSLFPQLAAEGKLGAYTGEGYWKSVDGFKDLREAEEALTNLVAQPGPWADVRL